MEQLDAFHVTNRNDLTTAQKQVRVDMFDFWWRRFRDAYFLPLRDWARQHGLASGRQVIRIDDLSQIDAALAKIAPTIRCDPPSPDLRLLVRRWPSGGAAFLFNERQQAYSGAASLTLVGNLHEVEPATGLTRLVRIAQSSPPSFRRNLPAICILAAVSPGRAKRSNGRETAFATIS